jgi:hypothetical protein
VETDQQLSEIKKVTFQDLGRKRKDFKYGIKQSLKLKEYRTPNQVIEATPKTNIISPKTLEVLVEQWFTEDDMVINTCLLAYLIAISISISLCYY